MVMNKYYLLSPEIQPPPEDTQFKTLTVIHERYGHTDRHTDRADRSNSFMNKFAADSFMNESA
jgi:hypothetical protein